MAKNYHLGSHFSTFEFGFKVRNAHKGQDAYSPTYDEPGANCFDSTGTIVEAPCQMATYLSGFTNPHYYFNAYQLGPVTNYPSIVENLNNLVAGGYNTARPARHGLRFRCQQLRFDRTGFSRVRDEYD